MDKNEIFEFLTAHPIFHLSTVEGDTPHVRGMLLYRADESGIIFNTGKVKDLHQQLTRNNKVEMSFNNGDFENLTQVRVAGRAELVEDLDLKKEIIEQRDFLKPWVEEVGYDAVAVYRVKSGVATVWKLATNFAPKEFVQL